MIEPLQATLRITEIFRSLQGEAATSGSATVFVRLTGCPMRCTYCDTAYAFEGGELKTLADICGTVADYATGPVTVTGGEPLAQPNCLPLLTALCDAGHQVSLETGGALPITAVDPRVSRVLDIKTPASGESARNLAENVADLRPHDQVKFVIVDRGDFEWSANFVREHQLDARVGHVWFSPSHDDLPAGQLADWMLAERVPARLQIQLHKYLWGDAQGR